ncbi:MAG: aspartate carbamoyltransferase catalytic subunit [Francisellaceae bacterium]|jgi:aspartate carbamoyltransferase catalytic subunit
MSSSFFNQDIISVQNLSKDQIELVLSSAASLKKYPTYHLLRGKIIASCFFEASTRTRLSFEAAVYRLGGNVIGFAASENTSLGQKGESLEDTIRMIECYSDAIIIRHSEVGSAKIAADISHKPVINAGDGANQHPTQTLLDLFTIKENFQEIDGLTIAVVGDLKYGRTVHSLVRALIHYNVNIVLCAQSGFELPQELCDLLEKSTINYSIADSLINAVQSSDIIYMTRCQKERFSAEDKETGKLILTAKLLEEHAKKNACVMHPLPRVGEIDASVDNTPYAKYFQQAENGLYVRQAILKLLLCK